MLYLLPKSHLPAHTQTNFSRTSRTVYMSLKVTIRLKGKMCIFLIIASVLHLITTIKIGMTKPPIFPWSEGSPRTWNFRCWPWDSPRRIVTIGQSKIDQTEPSLHGISWCLCLFAFLFKGVALNFSLTHFERNFTTKYEYPGIERNPCF